MHKFTLGLLARFSSAGLAKNFGVNAQIYFGVNAVTLGLLARFSSAGLAKNFGVKYYILS